MKQIAAELGICKPITTYYAQHSFATILKNSGVSKGFICEAIIRNEIFIKEILVSFVIQHSGNRKGIQLTGACNFH